MAGLSKYPRLHASQDRRLQRTVVQYLDISDEANKNVLRERIFEGMRDKLRREYLQCGFQLWRYWMMLCLFEEF